MTEGTTTADDLRERVESAYLELTDPEDRPSVPWDTPDGWGAQKWFAERLGVTENTVNRWMRGVHPVPRYALALLEELEQRAGEE